MMKITDELSIELLITSHSAEEIAHKMQERQWKIVTV